MRAGIGVVEYLADQMRFFQAATTQATRRGLSGLAALEWAEYLSWPECCRRADRAWKRDLLRRYAFQQPAGLWQAALTAHRADDAVGIGPPRNAEFCLPPILQFGPYPSRYRPTAKAPACLRAHLRFDTGTQPSPLVPVRRLNGAAVWTLEMSTAWLYDGRFMAIDILIDERRDYSPEVARTTLHMLADQWEQTLAIAETTVPSISAAAAAEWRAEIGRIRTAADEIGRARKRDRAMMLEMFNVVPGTLRLGPVEVLPDDLPDEWFEIFLGFALAREELLSVREKKQLHKAAVSVLMHWQASRYPQRELDERHAEQIVDRLSNVRRLLGAKSLFAYLARATIVSGNR